MSKVIPVRIPDELLSRLEARCLIRKQTRTDVILEALRNSLGSNGAARDNAPRDRDIAKRDQSPAIPANLKMNAAMATFMKTQPRVVQDEEPAAPAVSIERCKHREWVDGEHIGCRLELGHKGKCVPGERL